MNTGERQSNNPSERASTRAERAGMSLAKNNATPPFCIYSWVFLFVASNAVIRMSKKRFCVGLDLGSQNTVLAVYDHAKLCAFPLELGGDKALPSCVAVDDGIAGSPPTLIVGKRAEGRSARKCDGILCAYRQLLYASEDAWSSHRSLSEQRWHFAIGDNGKSPKYLVRGSAITLEDFIAAILDIAVTALCDAARPGGYLQLETADSPEWLRLAIAVPECLTSRQRQRIVDAAERAVRPRLGEVAVTTVNESLAVAVQFCSLPPLQPRRFMFGAANPFPLASQMI
jgi:molecular chaperone DnaK (HSP70)